ncbi:MAG: ribosomal L7Ae/L30e/S12e/Gadd45 family protein [Thermoproteota archaeon]|nr:ribosomal L7Ae/L30e/S12e/Gadd45 family protein [Thermoproteota archaeon]
MNEKKLKKILKDAVTNKKLKTGSKEVLQFIKGTNLILTSTSLPVSTSDKVKKLSEENNIPLYNYPGNSVLLGRLCSLSYRASIVSLKNISEEDRDSILNN